MVRPQQAVARIAIVDTTATRIGPDPGRVPVVSRHAPDERADLPALKSAPAVVRLSPGQDALVLEHLHLVRQVARSLREKLPRHIELEDLVSAGMLGLVDAAARYCPERNTQFRSYAQFRIRGAILDSLRLLDWGPRALRRKGRDMQEAAQALQQRLGRNPTESEISESMGMCLEDFQLLQGELKALEITSLHAVRGEETGEEELQFLPAREEYSPLVQLLQGESRQSVLGALEHLSERERLVMTLYYFEELTMKQIGATLGLVESRISQVHRVALAKLRGLLSGLGSRSGVERGRLRAG